MYLSICVSMMIHYIERYALPRVGLKGAGNHQSPHVAIPTAKHPQ
jgi:hypothetical protein